MIGPNDRYRYVRSEITGRFRARSREFAEDLPGMCEENDFRHMQIWFDRKSRTRQIFSAAAHCAATTRANTTVAEEVREIFAPQTFYSRFRPLFATTVECVQPDTHHNM